MECIPCKCPVVNIDRIYDDNGKREGKGNGSGTGNGRPKKVEKWMKINPFADQTSNILVIAILSKICTTLDIHGRRAHH